MRASCLTLGLDSMASSAMASTNCLLGRFAFAGRLGQGWLLMRAGLMDSLAGLFCPWPLSSSEARHLQSSAEAFALKSERESGHSCSLLPPLNSELACLIPGHCLPLLEQMQNHSLMLHSMSRRTPGEAPGSLSNCLFIIVINSSFIDLKWVSAAGHSGFLAKLAYRTRS